MFINKSPEFLKLLKVFKQERGFICALSLESVIRECFKRVLRDVSISLLKKGTGLIRDSSPEVFYLAVDIPLKGNIFLCHKQQALNIINSP